uniref:Uncharacterized protein n=1 Tax=Tanacetum cinerariifolium TaxID=118510 RepID=A0A6L2P0N0_TANCI|nr:hypothetical protein [Tanacetum cinerariifolium]
MEQMTQLTSMCEMFCQIVQKKQEEKRIEEEQAASARYWKIPACCGDDDDYDSAITPVLSIEEPIDSLSVGDEHLDIILATESHEVIKSSVEDLVPIPSEFEGIPDTMCDVHLDNNHTPLEAKDHMEIVINSNDDISSSDDDSFHEENIDINHSFIIQIRGLIITLTMVTTLTSTITTTHPPITTTTTYTTNHLLIFHNIKK